MTFHCACNIDERDCGYPDCNKGRKPLPEYVGTYQAAVSNNEGDKMNIPEGWQLVPIEPVYLVFSNSTCYDGSWEFVNKDEFDKADEDDRYKLFYTHPADDKLRKAAEEAVEMIMELFGDYGNLYFQEKMDKLRTALRETK